MLPVFGQGMATNAIAALAGMMAFPFALPIQNLHPMVHEVVHETMSSGHRGGPTSAVTGQVPSESCLADTICEVKDKVRWRTAAWKPEYCARIAHAVRESSQRYAIPPALILAVMVNESDMDAGAIRTTLKNGTVYAKDGGLMGIRCIVDRQGRCNNGHVRGLAWKDVMDPVTNIDLGTRELAHWRDGGGVTRVTVRTRDRHGVLHTRQKNVPCLHKTHAYWAHYNHGPRYIDHGPARHYPHRIAVLYYALARAMNLDTSELTAMRLTVRDPGKRPRTADHPVEARYRKLCQAIHGSAPACGAPTTAALAPEQGE